MKDRVKLDERPMRSLTDREVSSIIGSLVGGLSTGGLSDVATVRRAVRWWAENDAPWKFFEGLRASNVVENAIVDVARGVKE